jgi:hypothetical protein
MVASAPALHCRQIAAADVPAIVDLLTRGFPTRGRAFWEHALQQLTKRQPPPGLPQYGYLLESGGTPVGTILLICSTMRVDGGLVARCNLSSWYVEPAFRNYAPMLTKIAQRNKEVTYVNISAATWTWPIIETQGFSSYCSGLFFSVPMLSRVPARMTVETVAPDTKAIEGLSVGHVEMLTRHARYGCLSLVCRTADGEALPFILSPVRIRRGWIAPPAMQLIYCRDIADYVQCAGAIGRLLLQRGKISVLLDSNGPVAGLVGIFSKARGRKYFKGPHRPRLGDLADTELVLYGP